MKIKGFHGDESILPTAPWYKTHLSPTPSCRLSFKRDNAGCLQLAQGPPQWDMSRVATPQLQLGHFLSVLVVLLVPSLLPTHLHRCAQALQDIETTSDYSCKPWTMVRNSSALVFGNYTEVLCGLLNCQDFILAIHLHTELQATQHKAHKPLTS